MLESAVSRRSFLAKSAGAVALAAATGYISFDAWNKAYAENEASQKAEVKVVHSLCNACSNKCGFSAYVVDGRLRKLIPDPDHPNTLGKICGRGYGYTEIAYSKDRLTDPLKKNAEGKFEAISWEQAYSEIGEKVKAILASDGPQALAGINDPRPSGSYYLTRFLNALGSPNVYSHVAACNLSKTSGFTQVIGTGNYESDLPRTKMAMFLGRSYADGIKPSALSDMQVAHERGAHIVLVDPRCSNSIAFADEWVPIIPGTDQALLLGMSNVLVKRGLYDKDFVEANTVGFDEWAAAIAGYTPEWASKITGIPAKTIERLALEFAEAAPAASIEPGWRTPFGCMYQNSGETSRTACLFNTLLGCWDKEGGAVFMPGISAGKLEDKRFAAPPKPEVKKAGSDEWPLASGGTNLATSELAKQGKMKGMFFYESNMVANYSNVEYLTEAFSHLDLMVVIDVQMSETAMLADYVLPDTSYLERLEIPVFQGARIPVVTLRDQVIEKVHPNTRPVDQIFTELAEACGVGEYFRFTVEELAEAQLQTVGLSLDSLRKKGTVTFPDKAFKYPDKPRKWKTPSGKIQFTSDACKAAGLSPYPVWVEPAEKPSGNKLRLVGGKQAHHSHTRTANLEVLMQITKDYDLARVWLNTQTAADAGIKDGDKIEVFNDLHRAFARVKVTQRVAPGVLYNPEHYGISSPDQHTAYNIGLRKMDFVPARIEPAYGSACVNEVFVEIKKVGA